MSSSHRRLITAAALVGLLTLSGCATGPGSSPVPTSAPASGWDDAVAPAPDGRVIGVGMVLDTGDTPELCLGAVMESYPPQCSGLPIDGWSWEGIDGYETSGDTRWGSYAVYGTYDGERLTITDEPIMLALYDTVAPEDPTGGVDGTTSDADLSRIQDELSELGDARVLSVGTQQGYVWITVIWDDGTLQDAVDRAYGDGVVIVASALRAAD